MSDERSKAAEDFRSAAEGEPAGDLEAGKTERAFNYAAREPASDQKDAEPRYANEPVPDGPMLGSGSDERMSIEEQQASRFEEMQQALTRAFDRARRDRKKGEPDLER